jgi:hypothetical protein
MSKHIECDVDGCANRSRYLLTCGDRCPKHAKEAQPETIEYLNWCIKGATDDTN